MVSRSRGRCQTEAWQRALADAFTEPGELLAYLGLDHDAIPDLDLSPGFRMRVPRGYAACMRPGDPHDPLLRQVLPLRAERTKVSGYVTDPVDDEAANLGHGVLQKYAGRALLVTTGACAVNCRYCFRRHFPYAGQIGASALELIARDPSLSEVILSGGDPLMLDDAQIDRLIEDLESIAPLRRLRIHSRMPIVLPERVTLGLVQRLAASRLQPVLVIHANHPSEIGDDSASALELIRKHGIHLLNQSVLLRGVNDSAAVLSQLSDRLFACGALPYYLHQLDPVAGAAHFQVTDHDAKTLFAALRGRLPGYLVPRLVRERPNADAKEGID